MANESRVFRLPAGMSTQVVANAVSSFLSSAKGMEVQSAETTEGYVVQGRQEKDGWKTIAGMRMATTVQMIRMDDNLNVTVGPVSYTHLDEERREAFIAKYGLTEREWDVLSQMISADSSAQEIADCLFLSKRTVERHISALYEKTGAKSRITMYLLYRND